MQTQAETPIGRAGRTVRPSTFEPVSRRTSATAKRRARAMSMPEKMSALLEKVRFRWPSMIAPKP
jgi:hypothetical protein